MTMTLRRFKDFRECLRTLSNSSDNQAEIVGWDEDRLSWIDVHITPNGGLYEQCTFFFRINLPEAYPKEVPCVMCLTPIHHPNIYVTTDTNLDNEGEQNVCLSLFDDWESTMGLDTVIMGLLFLLHNPNIEDPLNADISSSTELEEFENQVKQYIDNGAVGNIQYSLDQLDNDDVKNLANGAKKIDLGDITDKLDKFILPELDSAINVAIVKLLQSFVHFKQPDFTRVITFDSNPCIVHEEAEYISRRSSVRQESFTQNESKRRHCALIAITRLFRILRRKLRRR